MAELKTRIVRRVRDSGDEELHQKLRDIYHCRGEAMPEVRRAAGGRLEIDPDSILGVMRGQVRAAGDQANRLCAELAADICQFGEDEKRVSDWLFKHCDEVLTEIEWSKQLDIELEWPRRRTILLTILVVAALAAVLSYFPLRTYFPDSTLRPLMLVGGVFLVLLWLSLEVWKRTKVAKAKRRAKLHREILSFLKESRVLGEGGSNEGAQEKAEAAFVLAKRVVADAPWGFCYDVLGRAQMGVKRMDEALSNLQQALEIARIEKDNSAEFSALTGLGKWHLAKGDQEAALTTFKNALEVAQRDNFP